MQTHATRSLLDPPGCLKTVTGLASRAFCCRNCPQEFRASAFGPFCNRLLAPVPPPQLRSVLTLAWTAPERGATTVADTLPRGTYAGHAIARFGAALTTIA